MSSPPPSRLSAALERIDALHAEDPRSEQHGGEEVPAELLYARRMSAWLERLEPDASEALRLAVRCQHLCRWRIPREDYPAGRAGYHAWRRACLERHAELAGEVLESVGYGAATVDRVRTLVRKRGLGRDPETQLLEDAACLVFLEHELPRFAAEHPEDRVRGVLRKTWRKISPRGREAAGSLDLPRGLHRLLEEATGGARV